MTTHSVIVVMKLEAESEERASDFIDGVLAEIEEHIGNISHAIAPKGSTLTIGPVCPDRPDITTVTQLRQEIAGVAVRLADESRDRADDLDQIEFLEQFAGGDAMKIEIEDYRAENEDEDYNYNRLDDDDDDDPPEDWCILVCLASVGAKWGMYDAMPQTEEHAKGGAAALMGAGSGFHIYEAFSQRQADTLVGHVADLWEYGIGDEEKPE